MSERKPLGPAWERPLSEGEIRAMVSSEPEFAPGLTKFCGVDEWGSAIQAYSKEAQRSLATFDDGALLGCGSVCAIGAFDGVHAGHRELVKAAIDEARARGLLSVAVTFRPDPAEVLSGPQTGKELLSVRDRIRLLASLGPDAVLVVPFSPDVADATYTSFLDWRLFSIEVRSIHVGSDFRMGRGGEGTVSAISDWGASHGVDVHGHDLVEAEGAPVTATRIRGLVHAGKVEEAARLLKRPHRVHGTVVHGRGEGTGFGFPTANVRLGPEACLPAEGVYAAFALVDGAAWPAAVNVGAPRTFGGEEGEAFLEATLVGFEGDLYGKEISVCFVAWLREPRKFGSFQELEDTVLGNVEWVRRFIGEGRLGA